jgi:hypothetical protein
MPLEICSPAATNLRLPPLRETASCSNALVASYFVLRNGL